MPLLIWPAVALLGALGLGKIASDEIGDQLDKLRPFLIAGGAVVAGVYVYKQVRK